MLELGGRMTEHHDAEHKVGTKVRARSEQGLHKAMSTNEYPPQFRRK